MKIFSLAILCAFFALEASPALAAAASGAAVPKNFDVLRKVSEEASRQIIASIQGAPPGGIVRLAKVRGVGDVDFIMENAFIEGMRSAGIRTTTEARTEPGAADTTAYVLSYQTIRLSIRYARISRRYWFGTKEVAREARADVTARFIDRRTGDVLWVREGSGQYDDVIPYSLLGSVEEEQYAFTKPPRDEFKMMRIIEPVIVAGIVVGLVALFFSNQSEK